MKEYLIVADSACDLPSEIVVENNIAVAHLKFNLDHKEYVNYLDFRELSGKDFYKYLREGNYAKTSQVNVDEFKAVFEEILKAGKDILVVTISSELSGTFNSATIAKEALLNKYPEREILIVDSRGGSLGEGLIVTRAIELKKAGKSLQEAFELLTIYRHHVAHAFTHDNLTYLKEGGRIGLFSFWLGTALNIKPIITADDDGKLKPRNKVFGRKKSIMTLIERVVSTYDDNYGNEIFISHADCLEEATVVKEAIEKALNVKVAVMHMMGPVIGSHGGPGTIAVFYPVKSR